jgi:hypothetical protein
MDSTVTLATLHPIWRETLATWEVLRRLGFSPEDIVLGKHPDGRLYLVIESVSFASVVCLEDPTQSHAFKDVPVEEIYADWEKIAVLWNTGTDAELKAIYDTSVIRSRAVSLLASMRLAGIIPPAHADA